MKQPREHDWIVMRLLFLLMGSDVSNVNISDVKKTLEYLSYKRKLDIGKCFGMISADHVANETLTNNPDSNMIRKFDSDRADVLNSLRPQSAEQREERRFFGSTVAYIKLPPEGATNE